MTDSEKAKKLLSENRYTFVAVKNGEVRPSQKRGVAPVIDIIDSEPGFLSGACIADKVIGKAAAMLLTAGGVKEIHTPLASMKAIEYIRGKQTKLSYESTAEYIINRDGTDMCPMEKTVFNISDEKEAERLIRIKLEELRRK